MLRAAGQATTDGGSTAAGTANGTSTAGSTSGSDGGGGEGGGWKRGRITYYGAPKSVAAAYDPSRGEGSFGILAYGSCGYTNEGGALPFPRTQYAASADGSPDFPGSCGRCYDIRCKTGRVLNNQGQPIQITNGFYEGDKFRPYLPAINPNVPDTKGRAFPGNPAPNGSQTTRCYAGSPTIRIRIADSCPCTQVLKDSAPGVAAGGETRTQTWCCSTQDVRHFDVSYDTFEQLAHPVYGVAMIEYRTVDCDSGAALPEGYIDKSTIYSGGPRPGWSWFPYSSSNFTLIIPGAATPAGTPSTCLSISPGGGLSFKCRECYKAGFQPFAGASAISFWIRSNTQSSDPFASSTPPGQAPGLKLILQKQESGNYCASEPTTNTTAPVATAAGGWFQFSVPTSAFNCGGSGITLADVTQFELQNKNERNADVCIGEIKIVR
ncbi:hypothetical protein OEZ85_013605 [Tetradesmus obliquus]|uniref:Expansin-like EG45 domain-containing protein n=1 Tax=Tetradesmus obliquus TaxID=3088 RepID=A0ABY8URV3_TETOB|nr:hypothetical protein OEZ85_013605 [Tetradesmus obliquus]WIA23971.1 hypothetical protein OEZ85_013605 [Tetradesmus obliquus]